MKEALKVIAGFPDQEAMFAYCETRGIGFHKMEPPYLTMARIAIEALKAEDHSQPSPQSVAAASGLPNQGIAEMPKNIG